MPILSRGRAAALATLAAAALAGCSADPGAPPEAGERLVVTPPAVTAIPRLDTVRGLALPTDAYRPTQDELRLVSAAEHKLIAECMTRYGFTWEGRPAEQPTANQVDRLYGVADPDTARRYGYHVPSNDGSRERLRRSGAGRPLSPTEVLVLEGGEGGSRAYQGRKILAGGCAGEARRRVTGVDDIDPIRIADVITVEMWQKSTSDPRVVEVVAAWSACMKESGYDYPSPVGMTDSRWSLSGPVTTVEIQVAGTDVRCKRRTNLIGVWFAVESGYERQAIQQRIEQLTEIKKRWTGAARTAAQLLGRPAPS